MLEKNKTRKKKEDIWIGGLECIFDRNIDRRIIYILHNNNNEKNYFFDRMVNRKNRVGWQPDFLVFLVSRLHSHFPVWEI